MNDEVKKERKAYAMLRMISAIERAIGAPTPTEQDKAARWAAAWGAIGGIRSPGIRLRRDTLFKVPRDRRSKPRGEQGA